MFSATGSTGSRNGHALLRRISFRITRIAPSSHGSCRRRDRSLLCVRAVVGCEGHESSSRAGLLPFLYFTLLSFSFFFSFLFSSWRAGLLPLSVQAGRNSVYVRVCAIVCVRACITCLWAWEPSLLHDASVAVSPPPVSVLCAKIIRAIRTTSIIV